MSTCIPFQSGAKILTSLGFEMANELVSNFYETGKGRLYKNPNGCIELTKSLWMNHGDSHTDLHDINEMFRIKDRIISLLENNKDRDKPFVIVDWGCGSGHTLLQLDAWLREQGIADAKLYGFANEIHPEWRHAPGNITFILDVADNLPTYFKSGSVDFMYSIAGLYYLFLPRHGECNYDIEEYFRRNMFDAGLFKLYSRTETHLEQLSLIMNVHGELLIDLPVHIIDIDYSLLRIENTNYRTLINPEKYGEHAFVVAPISELRGDGTQFRNS